MKRIIFGKPTNEYSGRITLDGNGWTIEDIDRVVKYMSVGTTWRYDFAIGDCVYEMYRYLDGVLVNDFWGPVWSFCEILFTDVPEDVVAYFHLLTEGRFT